MTTIKFGIQIENQFGFDFDSLKEIAIHLENKKYDSFWTCDHFFMNIRSQKKNAIEAYTMLSAISQVTSKLLLGTLVTSMSYREPSVLAKIISSLDHISKGRTIIGLGAGWKEIEYNAYGIRFPPLKERMDRLEEGTQIIIKMMTEEEPTFSGHYYKIEKAFNSPKPYNGIPPILIGGTGEKRTLKFVSKYADMSNFGYWEIDRARHLLDVLQEHCKKQNRNYNDITKTFYGEAFVAETEKELDQYIAKVAERYHTTPDKIKQSFSSHPGSFIGYPEEVIERYRFLADMGFEHFQIVFPYKKEIEMSTRFADQVIKKL